MRSLLIGASAVMVLPVGRGALCPRVTHRTSHITLRVHNADV
jgi:hypothetical protein